MKWLYGYTYCVLNVIIDRHTCCYAKTKKKVRGAWLEAPDENGELRWFVSWISWETLEVSRHVQTFLCLTVRFNQGFQEGTFAPLGDQIQR